MRLLFLGVCAVPLPAQAQSVWTGTTSNDWFTTGNWNPAAVPGAGTNVTINNGGPPNNPAVVTSHVPAASALTVDIGTNAGQTGTLSIQGGSLTLNSAANPALSVGNSGGGTLTVSGGGTLTGGSSYVALNPGSTGSATVTGTGSVWTVNGTFFDVGSSGNGTLDVLSGGRVNGGTFTSIGNDNGAVGEVTVSGTGSTFTGGTFTGIGVAAGASGTVTVSGTGATFTGGITTIGASNAPFTPGTALTAQGSMTVEEGASASASSVTIGNAVTATNSAEGNLTVTGAGSVFTATASLTLGTNSVAGLSSTGTLLIEDGGVLTSSSGSLGVMTGSTGEATVTGADSRWTMTGALSIGQSGANTGSGTLDVLDGGVVGAASFTANNGAAVTVGGADSALNITNSFTLGSTSAGGTLDVLDGGTVGAASFTGHNSTTVNVDGAGSALNLLGFSATSTTFTLGGSGAGNQLDVTGGAALATRRANLSTVVGSSVVANIAGTGTTWDATGLTLGGAGTSTMTVDDGAEVNVVGDFIIDGAATTSLTITGGAHVTEDAGDGSGQFRLGVDGHGTLLIEDGGVLDTLEAPGLTGFAFLARNEGSSASATITGTGSTWNAEGLVVVGNMGTATLDIVDGGTMTGNGTARLAFNPGSEGTVLVSGEGSSWVLDPPDDDLFPLASILIGIGGTGDMRVEDGAHVTASGIGVGSSFSEILFDDDFNIIGSVRHTGEGHLVITGEGTTVDLNVGAFSSFDAGGDGGTGLIEVLDGAVVTVADQGHYGASTNFIGEDPSQLLGHGTLTVDGAGSRVTFTQTLDIGEQATGVLNVTNGGFVSNSDGYLGSFTNLVGSAGDGTATVSGVGSIWQNSGFLRVGDQGTGTLNVLSGGLVSNTNGVIANATDSIGDVTVSGTGATWTNAGTLAIGGSGTATLEVLAGGSVSATGAASINALSTLNIGNGGAAGTFGAPTIANAGLIHFNHTGSTTLAASVSGAGSLTKDGAGTSILTGANTHSGGTTVNAGTLQIGSGGTTGSIAGNIGNGGTLAFNRSNELTFDGAISGAGSVEQNGAGTTILTGTSSFNGPTAVNGGRLVVNGSIANSAVSVNDGAVLGGNGAVGALTVASGGTVAPGNSIDILDAATATFSAGSLFEVEIDPTQSDRLVVAGLATIDSTAMVAVLAAPGSYTDGFEYLILDAGTRSGTFGGVIDASAFLDYALDHDRDPNQVWLTVSVVADLPSVAKTPNQTATAGAIQELGSGNPIFDAILALDEDAAREAFDLASGEIHASAKGVLFDDSRFVREAVIEHLREASDAGVARAGSSTAALGYAGEPRTGQGGSAAFEDLRAADRPFGLWGRGYGSWGRFEGDGNAATIERDVGGLIGGIDVMPAADWLFGAAGSYQASSMKVPDRASSASIEGYTIAGYGSFEPGQAAFRFGGSYGWHGIDTSRNVALVDEVLSADYDAGVGQVFGEASYDIAFRNGRIEPFAGLAYVTVTTDGFTEDGGDAALTVASSRQDVTYSMLGSRFEATMPWGMGRAKFRGMLAWKHAFGDVTPESLHAFGGGTPFSIAGVPLARDTLRLDAGLNYAISDGASFDLVYSGEIASSVSDHGLTATLTVEY